MNTPRCDKCEGSGIRYIVNGDADYDLEYCVCLEGRRAESANAMSVLKVNFIPSEGEVNVTRK